MTRPVFESALQGKDITAKIVVGLERIGHRMNALLKMQAWEHGLSSLQIRILLFIYFSKEKTTLSLLSNEFFLSKPTISIALKSMEQKGLIVRLKDDDDKRNKPFALTEWGRQIAHVAGFYPERLRKIVSNIDQKEKEILLKNINGILDRFTFEADQ